jgi:flagellin
MALGINDLGGLKALHGAEGAGRVLSKALDKLSSGLAVGRAADGPAALVISEGLRAQLGGISAAMRNAQEAFNVVSIAEGGMVEVNDLLVRARELAVRAANGATGDTQRGAA